MLPRACLWPGRSDAPAGPLTSALSLSSCLSPVSHLFLFPSLSPAAFRLSLVLFLSLCSHMNTFSASPSASLPFSLSPSPWHVIILPLSFSFITSPFSSLQFCLLPPLQQIPPAKVPNLCQLPFPLGFRNALHPPPPHD